MNLDLFGRRAWELSSHPFSLLSTAQVVTVLCGLAGNVMWARLMPIETFGGFKVVMGVISLVSTLCLLGTGQAAIMSASSGADGNLVRLVQRKIYANLAGGVLVLFAAGYYWFWNQSGEMIAKGLLVAAILFPTYNLADIWTSWLNGKSNFRYLVFGRISVGLISLGSIGFIVFLGVEDLWPVLFSFLFLQGIHNLLMMRAAFGLRLNPRVDEGVLNFGNHATVAMMFTSLLALDVLILNYFHSASDVAIYAIALLFPEQLKSLVSVVNQFFAPRFYTGASVREIWMRLRGAFTVMSIIFVILGVIGFYVLPSLMTWLFSDRYILAAEYGKWLWVMTASFGSLTILGSILASTKRPSVLYVPYIGFPIILCILYFVLVKDGVWGMVTAKIIASAILSLYYLFAFYYHVNKRSDLY